MQFSGNVLADNLAQSPLVCGVNVLVVGLDDKAVCAPFFGDLSEVALDFGEFGGGEDVAAGVGARKGQGAEDVLFLEDAVVGEGFVVLNHQWIEALC